MTATPTDDRGLAALAERLRDHEHDRGDRPLTRRPDHLTSLLWPDCAAAILGERGRFLPDGRLSQGLVVGVDEWGRLRQIETAAQKMRAAREVKAMAGPDLSRAIVAEQTLYDALDREP